MSDTEAGPATDTEQADLRAQSAEELAVVEAPEEEEEVAYDEEPDEAEADAHLQVQPESEQAEDQSQEQVQCCFGLYSQPCLKLSNLLKAAFPVV